MHLQKCIYLKEVIVFLFKKKSVENSLAILFLKVTLKAISAGKMIYIMYINKFIRTCKAISYFILITAVRQLPDNVIHGRNIETKNMISRPQIIYSHEVYY